MKKKALKYTIFLLLIPIIITIMLSLVQDKEMETNTVGVRERKNGDIGQMSLENFIEKIRDEIDNFTM